MDEESAKPVDSGLFRIVDGEVEKVDTNAPEVTDQEGVYVVGQEYADGTVLWIPGTPGDGTVWRSDDGGETWEEHAAR